MDYHLKRSNRFNLRLRIDPRGELHVSAPRWLSRGEIDRILAGKADWIAETRDVIGQKNARLMSFSVRPGDRLRYCGESLPVRQGEGVGFDGTAFFVPLGDFSLWKGELVALYRRLAEETFFPLVEEYSEKIGVRPVSVKVGRAKSYWGFCTSKGGVNFSCLLVMAPPPAIHYVVAHELCHLRHMNHSPAFWETVSQYIPDVAGCRRALKELEQALRLEDWDVPNNQ